MDKMEKPNIFLPEGEAKCILEKADFLSYPKEFGVRIDLLKYKIIRVDVEDNMLVIKLKRRRKK